MKSLVVVLFATVLSTAAFASDVSDQLQQCRTVQNDLKRLICYDNIGSAAFNRPVAGESLPAESPATSTAAASTASTDSFGVEYKEIRKNSAESMTANVAAVEQSKRGLWTITLDNGQKWRQVTSDGFVIRKGDSIVINRGILNSFLLSKTGTERQTKVARLQD